MMISISTNKLTTAFAVVASAVAMYSCSSSGSGHLARTHVTKAWIEWTTAAQEAVPKAQRVVGQAEDQAEKTVDEWGARYQARKIGELLGQTANQDAFADFPYSDLNYDLVEPQSNWIIDDNLDSEDSFTPFGSTSIDRGGWTEHRMERDKPDGRIVEYVTAYSDARPQGNQAPWSQTNDPYVNFGWWLETPKDIEGTGYNFATFVDGGNRYGDTTLLDFDGEATYEGPAAGVFVKRERTTLNTRWGKFTARVALTTNFYSEHQEYFVKGKLTDFVDSDSDTSLDGWSINLADGFPTQGDRKHHFEGYEAYGVADGYTVWGNWRGTFYEGLARSNYPGTVAGQFSVFSHRVGLTNEPAVTPFIPMPTHFNDEGFMGLAGAFGAHIAESRFLGTSISTAAQNAPLPYTVQSSNDNLRSNCIDATAAYEENGKVTYSVSKQQNFEIICITFPCVNYNWQIVSNSDGVSTRPSRVLDGGVELHKDVTDGKVWVDVYTDIERPTSAFEKLELVTLRLQAEDLRAQFEVLDTAVREHNSQLDRLFDQLALVEGDADLLAQIALLTTAVLEHTSQLDGLFAQMALVEGEVAELLASDYRVWGLWEYVPDDGTDVDDFEVGAFVNGNDPFSSHLGGLTGRATYVGEATGVYSVVLNSDRGERHSFDADVTLTANFGDDSEYGTIGGRIYNARIDDVAVPGNPSLTLRSASIHRLGGVSIASGVNIRSTDEDRGFYKGDTSINLLGHEHTGKWGGGFFGNDGDAHPTSVAGTFGAEAGPSRLLGVFSAHAAPDAQD